MKMPVLDKNFYPMIKALNDFDGTIICVSHDRYLINSLATSILEIDKIGFESGYCFKNLNYNDYIEKRIKKEAITVKAESGAGKYSFEEAKNRKNQFRSAKNRYSVVENSILESETKLSELIAKESDESLLSDYVALNELYNEKEAIQKKNRRAL